MAKRRDSRYEPGRRSPAWVKVKVRLHQELVVGGWLPGTGARAPTFGALLLGYHDPPATDDAPAGPLRFAGRVGTGFRDALLRQLRTRLEQAEVDACPFDPPPPREVLRTARWVQPRDGGRGRPRRMDRRRRPAPPVLPRRAHRQGRRRGRSGAVTTRPCEAEPGDPGPGSCPPRPTSLVRLRVPADARYARVVRVAVGAFAVRLGLRPGVVEDLRLAVDEALILLLATLGGRRGHGPHRPGRSPSTTTAASGTLAFDVRTDPEPERVAAGADALARFHELIPAAVTVDEVDLTEGPSDPPPRRHPGVGLTSGPQRPVWPNPPSPRWDSPRCSKSSTTRSTACSTAWITSWAMRSPRVTSNDSSRIGVDQQHLQLPPVAAVDEAGGVEAGDAVTQGEAAAGLDEPGMARRDGDGDPGGHERPPPAGARSVSSRASRSSPASPSRA